MYVKNNYNKGVKTYAKQTFRKNVRDVPMGRFNQ